MKSKKNRRYQTVKIIAGQQRHRQVSFIETDGLRPTGARIRETLFNWLQPIINNTQCLDLFAGSGILGFEALSRGAKHVTFVEKDPRVARQIQRNLKLLNLSNSRLINDDYQTALTGQYDIIFLDPPYSLRKLPTLLNQIKTLYPTYIYLEDSHPLEPLLDNLTDYHLSKSKKAGNIYYGLLQINQA